jgi:ferredoxin
MADKTKKWHENAPGRFYVDKECAFCTTCAELAPEIFKPSEREDHYFVAVQPRNDEELKKCRDAVEQCPTGAVGDDG